MFLYPIGYGLVCSEFRLSSVIASVLVDGLFLYPIGYGLVCSEFRLSSVIASVLVDGPNVSALV